MTGCLPFLRFIVLHGRDLTHFSIFVSHGHLGCFHILVTGDHAINTGAQATLQDPLVREGVDSNRTVKVVLTETLASEEN